MKITIISTIRGKRENIDAVQAISDVLLTGGHSVNCDHVLNVTQDDLSKMSETENVQFHKKILSRIRESEVVIAECSHQSMSVGYLIAFAASLGKIVLIFHKSTASQPNLYLTINASERMHVIPYESIRELKRLVNEFVDFVSVDKNIRFNLFLSSDINAYLNWVSKKFSLTKSDFIRKLILDKMSNDPLYVA